MSKETCQRCGSDALVWLGHVEYMSEGIDDTFCASCGQLQGKFPLMYAFEKAIEKKINELNEALLEIYKQGIHVKLELGYPGDPAEPERYGRLFLRLLEVKRSDKRIQV